MPDRPHAVRRFLWRAARNVLFLVVIAVGGLLFYGSTAGIPECLLQRVLARLNQGSFAIDISGARLAGLAQLEVSDLSLFRKRVLGAPLLESPTATIALSPLAWLRGRSALAEICAEEVVLRPDQAKCDHPTSKEGLSRELSFGVRVGRCLVWDTVLEGATFLVSGRDRTVVISELETAVHQGGLSGRLSGRFSCDAGARLVSGRLITNLDPYILIPICRAHDLRFCIKLINRFTFEGEPPRGEWAFDYGLSDGGDFRVTGDFRGRDCSYRGVDALRVDGSVTVDRRKEALNVEVNNLFIVRREGMASVAFSVDPGRDRVEFNAESTIDPLAAMRMVGVLTNLLTRHVVFEGATTFTGGGVVDYGDTYAATDFKATISADQVNIPRLSLGKGTFDLRMLGSSVTVTNIDTGAYGGSALADMSISIPPWRGPPKPIPYRLNAEWRDVDFERFAEHIDSTDSKREYQGSFSGHLKLQGALGEGHAKSLNGSGGIYVKDGRVFQLPLFGGFSRFMTRIIPGLDFVLRQSDMKSDFTIENGLATTEKIAVEGALLSLKGDGAYQIGGDLDFDVQVKLMKEHTLVAKLLRLVTYPISKLFEFRVRGAAADPRWYPVNFSLDLLERIGLRNGDKAAEAETEVGEDADVDKNTEVDEDADDAVEELEPSGEE